jgi:hypothetical protein
MRALLNVLAVMCTVLLAACNDRYEEGYRSGYNDGVIAGEKLGLEKATAQQRMAPRYEPVTESRSVSTSVCGGGGVNLNGKHIKPGKTGCVRVMSDGTVQRY